MATPLQQLTYILENLDEQNIIDELRKLQASKEFARVKTLFAQGMKEDDIFSITELLRIVCDLPEEAKEILFSSDEYLTVLQDLDARAVSYTDRTIYLTFLVDTINNSDIQARRYALTISTKYFDSIVANPSDAELLDNLSQQAELAYISIISLTAFYDLALAGSDDNLVQLIYQSAYYLADLLASRFYRIIGCRCATLLPLAAALFTVFSAAQTSDKGHVAHDLLCFLVQLLTTAEQNISIAILASVLKIVKEEGYTCMNATMSPKRSGFTLLCHTLLGAGANITAGIDLLCSKLGSSEYEEHRVEILCLFFGICGESDIRVAKLLGRSRVLVKWMNEKIGSVEPSDQAAVMELSEKLINLDAIDEELKDSFRLIARGVRCDSVEAPIAVEMQ